MSTYSRAAKADRSGTEKKSRHVLPHRLEKLASSKEQ